MNLKNIGKLFTSKFVGTGPSSYKKRIYRDAVSQRVANIALNYLVKARWPLHEPPDLTFTRETMYV